MRIIGGKFRGRRIEAPPGRGTRPMLDRVREAMFSTLAPWLDGAHVLDLFAGSGSLGLEALSRGAADVVFVEQDPRTAELLEMNVAELGVEAVTTVIESDALRAQRWARGVPAHPPDIVFYDPPYPLLIGGARSKVLSVARTWIEEHCADEAVLMFHAPKGELDADAFPGLSVASRHYGTNALWYLQVSTEDAEAEEAS